MKHNNELYRWQSAYSIIRDSKIRSANIRIFSFGRLGLDAVGWPRQNSWARSTDGRSLSVDDQPNLVEECERDERVAYSSYRLFFFFFVINCTFNRLQSTRKKLSKKICICPICNACQELEQKLSLNQHGRNKKKGFLDLLKNFIVFWSVSDIIFWKKIGIKVLCYLITIIKNLSGKNKFPASHIPKGLGALPLRIIIYNNFLNK